jgi:hypothetical protein
MDFRYRLIAGSIVFLGLTTYGLAEDLPAKKFKPFGDDVSFVPACIAVEGSLSCKGDRLAAHSILLTTDGIHSELMKSRPSIHDTEPMESDGIQRRSRRLLICASGIC